MNLVILVLNDILNVSLLIVALTVSLSAIVLPFFVLNSASLFCFFLLKVLVSIQAIQQELSDKLNMLVAGHETVLESRYETYSVSISMING